MASIRLPKRLFDLLGALAGLIAFSPAMAVIAGAILLEDGWPVLFRQERLDRRRRPFTILKFRSMRDGRITRVGRMLRATGLDELPQFINILRGDMSAVGPRPLTGSDVTRLGWMAPRYDFPLARAARSDRARAGDGGALGAPVTGSGSPLRGSSEPVARLAPGGRFLRDQRAREETRAAASGSIVPCPTSWRGRRFASSRSPTPSFARSWSTVVIADMIRSIETETGAESAVASICVPGR